MVEITEIPNKVVEEPKEPKVTIAPKSEAYRKAEEIREARELPKKPGDRVQFADLTRWLAILDDTQLQRLNLYIYRVEPVIVNQNVDPEAENSIDVFYNVTKDSVPDISEQYFIDKHGGGRYKIVVKDLDKPKTAKGGFFEANLYISMSQYPPKIPDLRVVDWDHRNNKGYRTWCKVNKLIDENNMPTIENKKESGATGDITLPMVKMFMDWSKEQNKSNQDEIKKALGANQDSLGKGIGELLLERMKQDDPSKLVSTLSTLMTTMGKGNSDMMPLFQMMMQGQKDQTLLMVESMKANQAMMLELIKSNSSSNPKRTTIEEMRDMLALMKELKGETGESKGSEAPWWGEALAEILPSGLQLINNIIAINAQAKGVPGVVVPKPDAPANTGEPQQTNQEIQTMTLTLEQKQQFLRQFMPMIQKWLTKEGCLFAEWMADGFPQGDVIVATIIKDGEEGLLATLKSMPDIWQGLVGTYGEPHIIKWVHSFINWKEELENLDKEN